MGKALSKSARRQMAELFPAFLSDVDREAYANDLVGLREWEMSNKDGSGLLVPQSHLEVSDDFNIKALMESAEDPITGTLRDLRIDDRDMPLAKNFYDFSFNIIGKDSNPPWARQLWTGAMLFGEVCPCCSKKSWLDITNVPKDFKSRDLPEYLQFLEHGKCPKCKRTKAELIVNHNLRGYMELVLVWGQRCVTGDTLVTTENGLEYIKDMSVGRDTNFTPFFGRVYNGSELENASDFYISPKKECVYTVRLKNGVELKGTNDHPVLTVDGFKRLEVLQEGDYVATKLGANVWGTKIPNYKDAYDYALANEAKHCKKTHIKKTIGVASLDWFRLLGLWVAEGSAGTITNWDEEVNSLLYTTLTDHFSTYHVQNLDKKAVRIRGMRGEKYLEYFVGGSLTARSASKSIPACVLTAPKEYVCAFLQGLFEGDGGIEANLISYCSISKTLVKELQIVLANLDIPSVVRVGTAFASNGSILQEAKPKYTLYLGGDSLHTYSTNIGFISKRKQKSLRFILKRHDARVKKMTFARDKLPPVLKVAVFDLIDTAVESMKSIPLPSCLDGASGASGGSARVKSKRTVGRLTLLTKQPYYWKSPDYVRHTDDPNNRGFADIVDRLRADNVPLTYDKLEALLTQVKKYNAFTSPAVKAKISYLESFLDRSVVWVRVVEKSLGQTPVTTYDLTLPNTHRFVANSIINHNSGKSESAAFFSAYQTHRFLMFPKLSTLTQALQASTPLTATFVSLTFTKAVSLLWTPLYNKIASSSWFNEYHKMLDYHSTKLGVELYRKKDLFIRYFHKGLHLYPSHPAGNILRGDTRFLAVVDELGLFPLPKGNDDEDEQSERANSDEAHKSLTNSLTTVQAVSQQLLKKNYNTAPTALMMGVSSPMSERDKVMRLLRESKTEQGSKLILGIQLPTWEVNPYIERDTPIIALAYERNAGKAERDFGANPPRVDSTFMNASLVENGIFVGAPNTHVVKHEFDQVGEIYATLQRVGSVNYPCVLALDAGYSNNAFAIAAVGYDFVTGKTKIPCVLEIIPQQGRVINFNLVYKNVILPLCNDLNVVAVFADRWNSLDLLHRVKDDRGLDKDGKPITASKQYSPKRRHFDFVHQLFKDKSIECPRISSEDQNLVLKFGVENYKVDLLHKPIAHLMLQCVTVKDVNDRLPPEKGDGYTDDMFRAMVLGASLIHEPKVLELLKKAVIVAKQRSGMPMPASAGRSGFGIGHRSIR